MKKNVLVSACLLGVPCRYDGKSAEAPELSRLMASAHLVPFCAEIYGGLPTPRPSAEIRGGRVVTNEGNDVTAAFERGAAEGVRVARMLHCECALLKDKSPSCGVGRVYSGHFDGTLVPGDGRLAAALREAGIAVFAVSELDALLEALRDPAG